MTCPSFFLFFFNYFLFFFHHPPNFIDGWREGGGIGSSASMMESLLFPAIKHTDTLIGRSFFPPTSSSLLINREVLAEYMGQIFNLYITFTILYIVKGEDE
jgi:hypothetical protein